MAQKTFLTVALVALSYSAVAVPAFAQLADLRASIKANQAALEAQVVADWITGPGKSELGTLSSKDLRELLSLVTSKRKNSLNGFSVTWTGQIRPQQSGNYTFSVSPIDITTNFGNHVNLQWMTVSINGQKVVNASPENWEYEGEALQLSADDSVPLEITYRYKSLNTVATSGKPACAVLNWEGPGISKSVVPTSVLRTPDGRAEGLLATYRRTKNAEVLATVVEPRLEHVWRKDECFISQHPVAQQQVVAEFFGRMTDAALFDECELKKKPSKHPLIHRPRLASYFLTGEQRREFLEILINRPDFLKPMALRDVHSVLIHFRYGTGDMGARLVGTWMQLHTNKEPKLTDHYYDYYRRNRSPFRNLTIQLVWQDHRGIDLLFDEYLELDDGTCCLPVAYTLSYGHLVKGKIDEWIELLDAKLAEDDLSGDRRVNWLLARAHAEDIRRGPAERHLLGKERLLAGRGWLDEARLIAESEENQLRTFRELLARIVSLRQFDMASQLIADAEGQFPAQQEILAKWQEKVDGYVRSARKQRKKDARASEEAYENELKRRQQAAEDRGDIVAADRYSERLTELKAARKAAENDKPIAEPDA